MSNIKEKEQQIVQEFSMFEDWMDKYNYLIEMGKDCPQLPEEEKKESNLIKGCQSRVWFSVKCEDGKMKLRADSDAVITKGIATLLIRLFDNQPPKDVYEAELTVIDEIGLSEHLSPTRSNGLSAMVKQIKLYALAFSLTENKK